MRLAAGKYSGFSSRRLVEVARRAAAVLGRSGEEIAVVFVTSAAIRKLNVTYRNIDKATDVLSFPADGKGDLGDIFIAPLIARRKAALRGVAYADYLDLLVAHSVLHLGGYDHETEKEGEAMERLERKILGGKSR